MVGMGVDEGGGGDWMRVGHELGCDGVRVDRGGAYVVLRLGSG